MDYYLNSSHPVFTDNGDVIIIGVNISIEHGSFNNIWRGRGIGSENEWELISVAPWSTNKVITDVLMAQMPIGEVLYVMGGQNVNNEARNDGKTSAVD
jgi:hypothetical protein